MKCQRFVGSKKVITKAVMKPKISLGTISEDSLAEPSQNDRVYHSASHDQTLAEQGENSRNVHPQKLKRLHNSFEPISAQIHSQKKITYEKGTQANISRRNTLVSNNSYGNLTIFQNPFYTILEKSHDLINYGNSFFEALYIDINRNGSNSSGI